MFCHYITHELVEGKEERKKSLLYEKSWNYLLIRHVFVCCVYLCKRKEYINQDQFHTRILFISQYWRDKIEKERKYDTQLWHNFIKYG